MPAGRSDLPPRAIRQVRSETSRTWRSAEQLLQLLQYHRRGLEVTTLLLKNARVEGTLHAVGKLRGERPLDLPAAERSRDRPARPPAIASAVDTVSSGLCGSGTDAELSCIRASRLSTALLELPAARLRHGVLPLRCLTELRASRLSMPDPVFDVAFNVSSVIRPAPPIRRTWPTRRHRTGTPVRGSSRGA